MGVVAARTRLNAPEGKQRTADPTLPFGRERNRTVRFRMFPGGSGVERNCRSWRQDGSAAGVTARHLERHTHERRTVGAPSAAGAGA